MENKNIIIILVAVIIVLAAILGIMFLQPTNAKESTKVKITSDKEQYENDGELSIKLTDLNKTPISKEVVNITIKNSKGKVVVDDVVKTNSKGKAKLDLDLKKGKYTVNVTYSGNDNYTGNTTKQKLTIKEEVKETVSEETYSSSSSGSDSGGYDKYSPQYGTYVKQYTDSNGVQHIDGADGMHESYDPNTRLFTHDDGRGHVSSEYR